MARRYLAACRACGHRWTDWRGGSMQSLELCCERCGRLQALDRDRFDPAARCACGGALGAPGDLEPVDESTAVVDDGDRARRFRPRCARCHSADLAWRPDPWSPLAD